MWGFHIGLGAVWHSPEFASNYFNLIRLFYFLTMLLTKHVVSNAVTTNM